MTVQEKIKHMQVERNWSVNHMALEADISNAAIEGWYKKRSMPTIEALGKICNAFGITLSEFFNDDSDPMYLTEFQKEFLLQLDLLHNREKEKILSLIKEINDTRKSGNPI